MVINVTMLKSDKFIHILIIFTITQVINGLFAETSKHFPCRHKLGAADGHTVPGGVFKPSVMIVKLLDSFCKILNRDYQENVVTNFLHSNLRHMNFFP